MYNDIYIEKNTKEIDRVEYEDLSIQEAFEKVINRYPNKVAIVEGENALTYSQFNYRINQLVDYLKSKGVDKGKRVVIIAERCIDSVAVILSLIKIGAIYVPVDPEYPKGRIEYVINDCNAYAVCCFGDEVYTRKTIRLSHLKLKNEMLPNPVNCTKLDDPAYITYTSGTTGMPKGMIIPQKAIIKLKVNAYNDLLLTEKDIIAQFSTMASTASVSEIFFSLLIGATLVMTSKSNVLNVREYEECCIKNKVNVLIVSPRYFMEINVSTINKVITLGEASNIDILNKVPENVEFINLYGTSETGGAALCWHWDKRTKNYRKLPIGKSVKNVITYIVDDGKICDVGQIGELCIATDGLMKGYLKLHNLTSAKIKPNPFGEGTIYHSGDRVMLQEDGNIVYIGRVDDQIKINGYRVELSDVENSIKSEGQIKACAVIAKENTYGEKQIHAYITSDNVIDIGAFRKDLLKKLPHYMMPSYIKQIDKIPLTHNGKLDRTNLPDIEKSLINEIVFKNKIEERIFNIYKEILGTNCLDCEKSFFELGGNSLKAIKVINEVAKVYNFELSIQFFFEYSSVTAVAELIARHTGQSQKSGLEKAQSKEFYDLSSAQKRIYLACQADRTSLLYNLPRCFVCKGMVDVTKVKKTFEKIVKRHEILRTSFVVHRGKVVQKINSSVLAKFDYIEEDEMAESELISNFLKPFDLTDESLVRMRVVKRKRDYVVLIDMHHIVADGSSYNNFLAEFNLIYAGYELEPVQYQYKDYSEWMKKRDLLSQKQYWMNELSGDISAINIPLDHIRQGKRSYQGKTLIKSDITKDFLNKVKMFSDKHGVTEYMVYLVTAMVTLAKYSRQEDITIGSPYAARMRKEIEKMQGMFVNTLVLRGEPNGHKRVIDFIQEIKERCIKAYANQEYPFEQLVEDLGIKYDLSRNPLFDVMLVMENQEELKMDLESVEIQEYDVITEASKFDLCIYIFDQSAFSIRLEYCTELFDEDTAQGILKHYVDVLNAIIKCDEEQRIEMIEMMGDEERQLIINTFSRNAEQKIPYVHILEQIEQQIIQKRENVAVTEMNRKMTYQELDDRSSYLAYNLIKAGVKKQDYICVISARSIEFVISFLAIMKVGAIYVPIDPDLPQERIRYICGDCNPKVILVEDSVHTVRENVYVLGDSEKWKRGYKISNQHTELSDALYCIYTSGTTGKPKGVLQKISTISNLVAWEQMQNQMKGERISLLASPGFDVSIQEMATALANGCNLVVVSDEIKKEGKCFSDYIIRNKVDMVFCTPSYWDVVTSCVGGEKILNQVKTVILAGESMYLNKRCIASLPKQVYMNHYGPTETHVITSKVIEQAEQRITIGKPIMNHMTMIMNGSKLCAIGEPGELCIVGEGVAIGYLGMPELTAEKFVETTSTTKRMYRTGDLVRWLSNGEIEYLGRMDKQIKIRGYRIELGEIESVIRLVPQVEDCVVIVREDSFGENKLYAYLTADIELNFLEIRKKLKRILPEYMIPSFMLQIDKIPITMNGKLNISELPEIIVNNYINTEKTMNAREKGIADIFKKVLRINSVSIDQDFFDLGGHSLNAMKLVNHLCEYSGIDITIQDVFRNPTIEKLARYLEINQRKKAGGMKKCLFKEKYIMSSAQTRVYLTSQMDETGILYNIPSGFIINEILDGERVKFTIKKMIERHEILRTGFVMEDGQLIQKIFESICEDLKIVYQNEVDEKGLLKEFTKPFELAKPPLFRMELVVRKKDTILLLDMHHIIGDGTSYWNFIREFFDLYADKEMEPPYYQYRDYSEWMQERDMAKQEEYWVKELAGEIPMLNLPYDYSRPLTKNYTGNTFTVRSGKKNKEIIKIFSKKYGVTEYMVLLSAFFVLLNKYSGQHDIIVGTPIAGRIDINTENMLGMFVNTLPIRMKMHSDMAYLECLKLIKKKCLLAYENQEYSLENLMEKVDFERDASRNPIFDVLFAFQDTNSYFSTVRQMKMLNQNREENAISKFDISLTVDTFEDEYIFYFEYCKKLFDRESIQRFAIHYQELLKDIITYPEKSLNEITLLSEEEKHKLVYEYNNYYKEFPKKNLIDLFEEQVEKTPNSFCIDFEGRRLSYRELNMQANEVAYDLVDRGVAVNDFVALYVERSIEMIIGMIAILKAGAAYLPIDPVSPAKRVEEILKNSETKVILTYGVEYEGVIEAIDLSLPRKGSSRKVRRGMIEEAPLYMIYTSGTTGKSKGVVAKNNSFVNMVYWYINEFGLNEKDNILLISSIGFDLTQKNIFAPLLVGGCIYIYNQWNYDSAAITEAINKNRITIINCAPSVIYPIIHFNEESYFEKLVTLRYLFLGGEIIKKAVFRSWLASENCFAELVNTYGPTECTDIASFYRCKAKDIEDNKSLPIGKPICNTQIYVLNKCNRLCGIGVPGELCIAGTGVSKGYWKNEELSNQRFINNPFGKGKLYKTGDVVRWKEDGNIEFIGREDGQVKIRGFRIELEDISARIRKQPGINDVAVVIKSDSDGDSNMVAYYVASKEIDSTQLRNNLKEELPAYMMPVYFVQVDCLPITQNGKLNIRELPDIQKISIGEYKEAISETEKKLCKLFAQVLKHDKVSVSDSFFDLGGHSLKAVELINLIEKVFKVRLSLKTVFEHPTVMGLTIILDNSIGRENVSLPKTEAKAYYEMSSTQKRTFMSYKLDEKGTSYNSPYCFILNGNVKVEAIHNSIQKIIDRHEILRTSFEVIDNRMMQVIKNNVQASFVYEKDAEVNVEVALKQFVRCFELAKPPLFRVKLIQRKDDYVMFWDIHHIVSDGVSVGLLIKEFSILYNGEDLLELSHQYKDYSEWMLSRDLSTQKKYWLESFADEIPVLNLPSDYTRPQKVFLKGNILTHYLDRNLSRRIKESAYNLDVTEYMLFLSSFMILIGKYSGQEDVIVGCPISARTQQDTQNMLGMFVNTLALRGKPAREKEYRQFVKEIKETCIKAYDNQEYPFEELIEELNVRREMSRNPLFDVMLSMQNFDVIDFNLDGVTCKSVSVKDTVTKFDISIDIAYKDEKYELVIEYAEELFSAETMQIFIEHFVTLLECIINSPYLKISEIQLISDEEKTKILETFNDTTMELDNSKFIMDYFEEQVERTPNKIAITYDTESITYRELNNVVNIVASLLVEVGVGAECFVALLMERSIEMVIGMLAILKAGGAYVPMDIRYPEERIQYMLNDCQPKAIFTNCDTGFDLKKYLVINLQNCRAWSGNKENLSRRCDMSNLAYCIYTSGTTGKPKGTLIEHKGLYNLMLAYTQIYNLTDQDVVLQVANYVFDQSVWDIFNILIVGGTLCLISFFDVRNPKQIAKVCNRNCVTIASFTPAMLAELNPDEFKTMRVIDSSGEAANERVLNRWLGKCRVINTYGPTEVTVNSSSYVFEGITGRPIPIGKPINNYKMYVLERNDLCGIGIWGELCIAGIGVARGYLNATELSDAKFVTDPFSEGKMYRTGDLARWRPDGNIEFGGRIDEQVKVRGYRVELGDIESTIRNLPEIDDCAVIVNENMHGDKSIYAYIVSKNIINITDLKYALKKELPDYMIPSFIYQIDRIPFNASGKVDRRSLPKMEFDDETNYLEPHSELERSICNIFSNILGIKRVGREDDFFMLGGHSLLAIRLSMELQKLGYEFSLKDIFIYHRVCDIARFVNSEDANKNTIRNIIVDLKRRDFEVAAENAVWSDKKVFIELEPYNQAFYISCFYNALFAGIEYFDINPSDIMVQSIPSYMVDSETNLIREKFIECKPWRTVIEEKGVRVVTYSQCDDITNAVKMALRKNGLIIIQIDGYYSPIRKDLYGKIHWVHNILINGFNESVGEFSVIEQSERNLLDYKQRSMSFYDLERAFIEGLERFGVNPFEPPVVVLEETEGSRSISNSKEVICNKSILINNVIEIYPMLIDNLTILQDNLERCLDIYIVQKSELSLLLDNLNRIVESKKVFSNLLQMLLYNDTIKEAVLELLNLWEVMRAKIARMVYSNKKKNLSKEEIRAEIENIICTERRLLDCLYHFGNQSK